MTEIHEWSVRQTMARDAALEREDAKRRVAKSLELWEVVNATRGHPSTRQTTKPGTEFQHDRDVSGPGPEQRTKARHDRDVSGPGPELRTKARHDRDVSGPGPELRTKARHDRDVSL
jgi:hypothetical protein